MSPSSFKLDTRNADNADSGQSAVVSISHCSFCCFPIFNSIFHSVCSCCAQWKFTSRRRHVLQLPRTRRGPWRPFINSTWLSLCVCICVCVCWCCASFDHIRNRIIDLLCVNYFIVVVVRCLLRKPAIELFSYSARRRCPHKYATSAVSQLQLLQLCTPDKCATLFVHCVFVGPNTPSIQVLCISFWRLGKLNYQFLKKDICRVSNSRIHSKLMAI